VRTTVYFEAIRKRPDRAVIQIEWIQRTILSPAREAVQAMKIRYFTDTDTLYIEFRDQPVVETKDLDQNTVLDVGVDGDICAIPVEHASRRRGIPEFSYEQVTA